MFKKIIGLISRLLFITLILVISLEIYRQIKFTNFVNKGNNFSKEKNYNQAILNYNNALNIRPNSVNIYIILGNIHQEKEEIETAIKYYQKAEQHSFKDKKNYEVLGDLLRGENKLKEAEDYYIKAKDENNQRVLEKIYSTRQEKIIENYFAQTQSKNFQIFYNEKDSNFVPVVLEYLEKAYYKMNALFGFYYPQKVIVKIYPDFATFQKVYGISDEINTIIGAYVPKSRKIVCVSSQASVLGSNNLCNTLSHEYIHFVLTKLTANKLPTWLQEGLATHLGESSYQVISGYYLLEFYPYNPLILKEAYQENKIISISDLEKSWCKFSIRERKIAYSQSYSLVEYLIERKGWEGIRNLIISLNSLNSFEEALKKNFILDKSQLEENWKDWLVQKKF